ncbi:MAG TPA: PaaI family thioesterase, partial [Gaiellaceae bacterium]
MTDAFTGAMPFADLAGVEIASASAEEVTAQLAWDESRCTAGGILHGGALMTLADSAGGLCAFLNLPDGAGGTATVESKTNFFRPVSAGRVTAVAQPVNVGRSLIVVQTELRDDEGLYRADIRRIWNEAARRLTPPQRAAFALHEIEGFGTDE